MDSFTENLLLRARERQRLLEGYSDKNSETPLNNKKVTLSQPNLNADSSSNLTSGFKNKSEGNVFKTSRSNTTTRVSSEITSSPKSHKTLNIQNDNFNMEIKVSSADNVRVEVQIEEQHESDDNESENNEGGLRKDAKNRLNRLGKLYAGGEDADISSPIHRTETKFCAENMSSKITKPETTNQSKRGLSKLADLAQSINQFEDDLTCTRNKEKEKCVTPVKKSWKPPAPQPPEQSKKSSPLKPSTKPKAPSPPKNKDQSSVSVYNPKNKDQNDTPTQVQWDKKVLDSLESQGFTRTESSSRLVYKYDSKKETKSEEATKKLPVVNNKENVIREETVPENAQPKIKSPVKQSVRSTAIADKAALFESSPNNRTQKDPALLSVSERKALFEKNKGTALVPKAPFAMATPIKSDAVKEKQTVNKPPPPPPVKKEVAVPQAQGIANKVAALFEGKATISQKQIEDEVREQRQKEMDMLLNRFHKPVDNKHEAIPEEPEDVEDATEETLMINEKEKPSKIVASSSDSNEKRRSSGNKRCSKADSPKVAAVLSEVKRIKVGPQKAGRLYPSLTDIESMTETENENEMGETRSPTPNNSSFEGSIAESDDANTSFGRDILQTVCKSQVPQKRQIADDSTASELSDVLDDMDDYIDEALAYTAQNGGPTPPKQGRQSPLETSHSFHFKSFQSETNSEFKSPMKRPVVLPTSPENLPTHVVDGNNVLPLTHTVSFYRKQQSQASNTPVKHVSRQPLIEESAEADTEMQEQVKAKMHELRNEIVKQEKIISQTSQALNLCNSTPEFMGSTEQVEAERVLLVATHRRQAALNELQRLEVENTLRPQRQQTGQLPLEKGSLTISKIVLPLKQKYVTALAAAGGKGHHVVCLVKYADQVVPTNLVSTVATSSKNPELELNVPGVIKLNNVYSDFTITFEVYCLQAQEEILPHEVKYHIKKPSSSKLTPKKAKQDSRLMRPIKESPAGPQAVRSPTFAAMGYIVFSLQSINKKQWSLNNTPSMSPLEGTVEMCVSCELALSVEHRGFLTMFEDISGFGAWHRRWCLLKGHMLSYWKYPDDERKTPPINSIDLKQSITKQVGPVSREICARLHTFLIETERPAHPQDKESLVTLRKGDKTVIRHLLSADTKEERIEWCKKFNAALGALNIWGRSQD